MRTRVACDDMEIRSNIIEFPGDYAGDPKLLHPSAKSSQARQEPQAVAEKVTPSSVPDGMLLCTTRTGTLTHLTVDRYTSLCGVPVHSVSLDLWPLGCERCAAVLVSPGDQGI